MNTIHLAEAHVQRIKLWTPPVSRSMKDWLKYLLAGERGATGTSLSNFLEDELLDHVVGNSAYSAPGTLYFSLFTAAPSDAGGGTEVTGGSYARQAITNNLTQFPASSGGSKSNANAIDFGVASANWGTITHAAVLDVSSNYLFWGALTASKTVGSGDGFKFNATKFVFALD